jgi:hypothetical protein
VIGRKGTGKTATLYKLASDLSADPRNHFCTVRPVDYELDGILTMLRQEITRSGRDTWSKVWEVPSLYRARQVWADLQRNLPCR